MKKYISLISIMVLAGLSWVFAYNNFVKTPSELLSEYVQAKCGITEYGVAQKVTYENYKQIGNDVCDFKEIWLSDEDADILANLVRELRAIR